MAVDWLISVLKRGYVWVTVTHTSTTRVCKSTLGWLSPSGSNKHDRSVAG